MITETFSNLNCFSSLGNEIYIDEIAARLKNIFLSRSLSEVELRKVFFLLILNTDASFSRDLNEDFSICHLLNNFPPLSKCLFVNLVWQLKLEKFFYEAIKFTPTWFMLQFLPEAVDSLRFSKPLEVIEQVKKITEAIYSNICRIDFKASNVGQQVELKIILNKLLEHMMSLLRNYNTPNSDESFTKSKKKLREYLGISLNYQLSLVLNCFELYQTKPKFTISDELQIYRLMVEKEPELDNHSTSSYSSTVNDSLVKVNIALLNTLQNSVMNITLDDFMCWVEIDIEDPLTDDEDLKRDNLQKSIGEMSYSLVQLINVHEYFQHDVAKHLQTISIKPKSLEEIAKEATVGTVLEKVESSFSRRVWFEELLNRSDTLYCNSECLQTVIENMDLVNFKDLMKILSEHQNYDDMDREDELLVRKIFKLGCGKLNCIESRNFGEELIRTFGVDYKLEEDEAIFASELTNYLNKLTENNLDELQMWQLVVTNPSEFYSKLLRDIPTHDKTQIEIVLRILAATNSIADDFVKTNVLEILEVAADAKKTFMQFFLAGLFKQNLIDRKEFIRDVLMSNLAKAMASEKLQVVFVLLSSLKQISTKLKVEDLLAPLLILLTQILDKCRWDLISFTSLKESIIETAVEITQDLVRTILIHGSRQDKDWIVARTEKCKPMTKFYMQKLQLETNQTVVEFDKFLHPVGFENLSKDKTVTFLCETIVRCTLKELKWLMTNINLQSCLTESVLVVSMIVKKSGQQGPTNCLHKCVSDYVRMLKVTLSQNNQLAIILMYFFIGRDSIACRRNSKRKITSRHCQTHQNFPSNIV